MASIARPICIRARSSSRVAPSSSSPPPPATAPRPSCPRSCPTEMESHMTRTTFRPRRRALVAAAAALPLAALAACSSDTGEGPSLGGDDGADEQGGDDSGASDGGGDSGAYADVIASGPVAADDVVSSSAWASAIKERGELIRGGTTANQVFSLIDPGTDEVTGFDAGITQLLAKYILGEGGEGSVDYVDTTVDTRETVVQNGTVDCVIATYSITPERLEVINF